MILPSRDASAEVQANVKQQIFALLQAAGSQSTLGYEPSGGIQPDVCSGSYNVHAYWIPSFDHGTEYYSEMDYQRCGNNSIYLTSSKIRLVGGAGYYWDHDQYASGNWGRGCASISTNGNTGGLNSTHTAGYYYEPYVSSGSNCTVFDSYSYYDVGPAN